MLTYGDGSCPIAKLSTQVSGYVTPSVPDRSLQLGSRMAKEVNMPSAADIGLGSLNLEYDANKNPEIFQQLCQLDLKQVINKVTAEPPRLAKAIHTSC